VAACGPANGIQQGLIIYWFSKVTGCTGFFGLLPGLIRIKGGEDDNRDINASQPTSPLRQNSLYETSTKYLAEPAEHTALF
jgi:hypothetical protein